MQQLESEALHDELDEDVEEAKSDLSSSCQEETAEAKEINRRKESIKQMH